MGIVFSARFLSLLLLICGKQRKRFTKLTKELRQEIVSYLFPFPPMSKTLAFRLAILIFAKTRFCSHINFIGRCLYSKVIPKGFRSNFYASYHSNQYLRQIRCAQNSCLVGQRNIQLESKDPHRGQPCQEKR